MRKYRRAASRASTQKKTFGVGPIVLIALGAVLILSVVIWQLSLLPDSTVAQSSSNFDIPYPEINRTPLADAKAAFDDSSALFVDVRDSGTFDSKHIVNSVNIPLDEFENRYNELPKDRWIITVCT